MPTRTTPSTSSSSPITSSGQRTVTFTNPQYWATKAGRQFEIDLSKGVPKDLLRMQSSQVADPRYEQIVIDFREFRTGRVPA